MAEKKEDKKEDNTSTTTTSPTKEENINSTNSSGKVEKVVYKVVHVPYYYPVPVDIEWYYKHHEQYPHPHESGFPFLSPDHPQFEHIVPPAPPFSSARHRDYQRDYSSSRRHRNEDSGSDHYNNYTTRRSRSISPPSHTQISPRSEDSMREISREASPTMTNGESRKKDQGEDELKEKSIEVNGEKIIIEEKSEGKLYRENVTDIKKEIDDVNDSANDDSSDRSVEVNRKRKRYLMTFPYDQRKKGILAENAEESKKHGKENDEKTESRSNGNDSGEDERKYRKHVMIPADHNSRRSSHAPYVMVPVRSSQYMSSPEMRYESRYSSSKNYPLSPYERGIYERPNGHRGGEDRDYKSSERSKSMDKEEQRKQELRFHTNGRRARTVFSRQQLLTLNNVFDKHPFVSGERMSELSDQLGLDRKIVKIWFQNKRQYARKKGNLVERDEDYFFDYPNDRYVSAPPPTMAERWKN